ncbi:enoyl-CoA hydratase [Nocardioides gilvus]|uniref:enoyl-CoA hydratase n=1 Tax=Nocardioides gilvus TaxID=1735589 RepID=UPI000D743B32|nr:enoyl-CoA hydratase [Nocardioides gilvus]
MPDHADDELLIDPSDGVLRLTFNRPQVLNAVSADSSDRFSEVLEQAVTDETVRVVLLTGAGYAFSAGADLSAPDAIDHLDHTSLQRANRAIRAIVALDKPVVAAVNGPAAGVGCAIALACDLAIAHPDASFFLAFTRLGLMPDGGSSATAAASVGRARAMRMALLAEPLSAQEAYDAGLVSHLAASAEEFEATTEKVVRRLARGAPLALAATKKAVNSATLGNLAEVLETEMRGQSLLLRTDDAGEGIRAFIEGRRPGFTGD